jgi:sugar transferase EpsL
MKRLFDVLLSSCLLIILSPLFIAISISSLLFIGNPIFFKQLRPGLNKRPFYLIKYRTMKNQFDEKNNELSETDRITSYGAFLRNYSLDELPEILNVFKGEMSFVGPRPLLMQYLTVYNKNHSRRHDVRPGITGWAQINGRNTISWEQKLDLDIWYIENKSFYLDIKILMATFVKVLTREGINQDSENSMKLFTKEDYDS